MSTLNHEPNQIAGVTTRSRKRGLKCWTRFNRNGRPYTVCNGSKGQKQTRKRKRKTKSIQRTHSTPKNRRPRSVYNKRYSLRSNNRKRTKG